MAAIEDCEQALHGLASRLAAVDPELRRKHAVDRTLSVHVTDLGVTWSGMLREGRLHDISRDGDGRAQIRLAARSDDLMALTAGELGFASAWASGRLRVDANPLDLLRLRSLL